MGRGEREEEKGRLAIGKRKQEALGFGAAEVSEFGERREQAVTERV